MASRFDKIVHYIIHAVPPEQLGVTKLAKILWFSDVEFYRQSGRCLTQSDNYKRRNQGPLHADFYDSIARLKSAGAIAERAVSTPVGARRELLWLSKPDMAEFDGQELATLHSVIDQIMPLSAKQVSDLSHVEPWDSAYDGERMPVAAAAVQFGDVEDEDIAWAEREFDAVCPAS